MKFRKLPVEIEAFHYTKDCTAYGSEAEIELFKWRDEHARPGSLDIQCTGGGRHNLYINKSKVWMDLEAPIWIIVERDGDGFYPCTEEQFRETYTPVLPGGVGPTGAFVTDATNAFVATEVRDILLRIKADVLAAGSGPARHGQLEPETILSIQTALDLLENTHEVYARFGNVTSGE